MKQRELIMPIFLVFLVCAIYFNSLDNEFTSDSKIFLLNPEVLTWKQAFSYLPGLGVALLRVLEYRIAGTHASFHRFVNIFFHAANVLFIYLLLKNYLKKKENLAILTTVVLAVHPVLVESITWVAGGSYPFSTFFFLPFLICYFAWRKDGDLRKYYLSIVLFLVCAFTFEKTISLILVIFLYELMWGSMKKEWKKLIPFVLITLIQGFFLIEGFISRTALLTSDYYQDSGEGNPLIQIPIAITEYLKLIFWPKDLTLYHTELQFMQVEYIFRLAIFCLFIALILFSYVKARGGVNKALRFWERAGELARPRAERRRGDEYRQDGRGGLSRFIPITFSQDDYKYIFFWLSFFIIALLPTLTPFRISWIVAERYVYLGSVGIFAVIGLIVYKLSKVESIKYVVYTIFAVAIVALAIRTVIRNNDWQNEDTLWIATAKTSPSGHVIHNNLGDVYTRWGDLERAAAEFKLATQIQPNYADAYHNLANVNIAMSQAAAQQENKIAYGKKEREWLQEAINNYGLAVKYNPKLWQSYQNLATIFYQDKQYAVALQYLEKAVEINPALLQSSPGTAEAIQQLRKLTQKQ